MMTANGHSLRGSVAGVAFTAVLACSAVSCGGGVQAGMQVAFDLFGGDVAAEPTTGTPTGAPSPGPAPPAQSGASPTPPAQPPPGPTGGHVPPPAKPIPPDMVYGTAVVFELRETGGSLRQAWAFRKYKDQKVAGHGTVLEVQNKEFMGQVHINVELDVDGDGAADIVLNYLNPGLDWFVGVDAGVPVWYDGVMKRYDKRLYIGGTYIQPLFG